MPSPDLILALNFLDPDSKAPGSKPVPDSEREARRRSYRAAVDVARQTLQPHRLDGLIGQAPLAPATKDIVELALANADTVVLMRSLFAALERIGALLNMERGGEKKMPWTFGKVTDYQVTGDHATAKADAETIEFERVDGAVVSEAALEVTAARSPGNALNAAARARLESLRVGWHQREIGVGSNQHFCLRKSADSTQKRR